MMRQILFQTQPSLPYCKCLLELLIRYKVMIHMPCVCYAEDGSAQDSGF